MKPELDFEQSGLDYHSLMKLTKILAVGIGAGLKRKWCEEAAGEIESCVHEDLGKYLPARR